MSGAPDKAFDPTTTFVDLTPDDGARPIPVTPDFWERLGSGALTFEGRMVSAVRAIGQGQPALSGKTFSISPVLT